MNGLIQLFARKADAPRLADAATVETKFRGLRARVIVSVTIIYGFFYTCRIGFSVVKKPLIDEGVYTADELGLIGSVLLYSYGFSKLLSGPLADRLNVARFMPAGLFLSALVNLAMGANELVSVAIVLWALNGLFQGVGGPSSVVSLTQWFSGRERGRAYGVWSIAHSLGEGLTFVGTSTLVAWSGWKAAFLGPGFACLAVAVAGLWLLTDRPEAHGLPPVLVWKGETTEAPLGRDESLGRAQLSVLKMPAIWVCGLAAASMYVTRYAVNNWGVLFLQETYGYSLVEASSMVGLTSLTGVLGSVAFGFISDQLFRARRPPVTLAFGVLEILSLVLIFYGPKSAWSLGAGFLCYGFTLSGILAVLGGLFAVDLAPKRAAGTVVGLIGVFSYVGAGLQDWASGVLIARGTTLLSDGTRHYDFTLPVALWVGSSVLSMILAATLWRAKPAEG